MKTKKTVSTGTLDVRWPAPEEGDLGLIFVHGHKTLVVVTKRNAAGELHTAPYEKPEVLTFHQEGGKAKTR